MIWEMQRKLNPNSRISMVIVSTLLHEGIVDENKFVKVIVF
jgi:hypothetical protein